LLPTGLWIIAVGPSPTATVATTALVAPSITVSVSEP
jgi:hypothetical protein